MALPITGISFGINFLVYFIAGYHIWIKHSHESETIKKFAKALISTSIFFLFVAIGHITWQSSEIFVPWLNFAFILGYPFLFWGFALMSDIAFSFKWQQYKKIVFGLILIAGILEVLSQYFYPHQAVIDPSTGVTLFYSKPILGIMTGIGAFLSFFAIAVAFLIEAIHNENKILRRRAYALSIGGVLNFIGGPIHGIVHEPALLLLADIILLVGVLFFWSGIMFFHPKNQKSEGVV